MLLQRYLEQSRHRIEKALSNYLREAGDQPDGGYPARLIKAMRYSTLSGGKRLRAILCLMAVDAVVGTVKLHCLLHVLWKWYIVIR